MAKFKVGDSVVFGRCKRNKILTDVTIGKIYKITEVDVDGDPMFLDDSGACNFAAGAFSLSKPTKIVE